MPENDKRDAEWFQSQPRTCVVCAGTAWDMLDIVPEPPDPQAANVAWPSRPGPFLFSTQCLRARCTSCRTLLFIPLESATGDQ